MKISIVWTGASQRKINLLSEFPASDWDYNLHAELSAYLAKSAVEFIKPQLKSKRGFGRGVTAGSLGWDAKNSSEGFTVTFTGTLAAKYMDTGNGASGSLIYPKTNKGLHIDSRFNFQPEQWAPLVHTMGYETAGVPTGYSKKTVDKLSKEDKYEETLITFLGRWLGQ